MFEAGSIGFYIILVSFVMPILLATILIWFALNYQKKKNQYEIEHRDNLLKEQKLIIERQKAIELERNRIATEMHDDLGSGLTTIIYLGERIKSKFPHFEGLEILKKIENQSKELVGNMSEIIWTMNSRYDDIANLAGFMRRYAYKYLENYGMDLEFHIDDKCLDYPLSGEIRRNLFLILKEILHNAIKYSQMSKFVVNLHCNSVLTIQIEEVGGIGFNPEISKDSGNGIYNMSKRMEKIGGTIHFEKKPEAMCYLILYPLNQNIYENQGSDH